MIERPEGEGRTELHLAEDRETFAQYVLQVLHETADWGSDTLDDIAARAVQLGLATSDDNGNFRRADR